MTIFGAVIGTLSTLFTYLILIAALQRLFSIGKDLSEIRDLLKEFKREKDTESPAAGGYRTPATPEEWASDVPVAGR